MKEIHKWTQFHLWSLYLDQAPEEQKSQNLEALVLADEYNELPWQLNHEYTAHNRFIHKSVKNGKLNWSQEPIKVGKKYTPQQLTNKKQIG
jgi:hypothetical protein